MELMKAGRAVSIGLSIAELWEPVSSLVKQTRNMTLPAAWQACSDVFVVACSGVQLYRPFLRLLPGAWSGRTPVVESGLVKH